MKLSIKSIFVIMMMALVTIGGTTSCGSKKKMAKKEYEAKLEQAKKEGKVRIEIKRGDQVMTIQQDL